MFKLLNLAVSSVSAASNWNKRVASDTNVTGLAQNMITSGDFMW